MAMRSQLFSMYTILICITLCNIVTSNTIEDIRGCTKLEGFGEYSIPNFDFEDIPPCFCDDTNGLLNVVCMFGSKMSDLKDALDKVKKAGRSTVHRVSSQGGEWQGQMAPISKELFDGVRINRLEIQYCERNVLYFEPDALSGLRDDLTHIHIDSCQMRSVGDTSEMPRELPTAFRNLTSLVDMKIVRSGVEKITAGSFIGFDRMKNLTLSDNSIIEIEKGAFQGAIVLEALDIRRNGQLTNAVMEAINEAPSLKFISMRNANLGDLPAGSLDNLVNLIELQLLQCGITSIPSYAFKTLKRLKLLDLRINLINTIANNAFDGFGSLTELHLDGNFMKDATTDTFNGLDSLQRLGLSYCDFKVLRQGMFSGLKALKVLDIWNNLELMDIEDGAFDGLDNLTDLLLSRTQKLGAIHAGAFRGLDNLRVLDISGGYIRQVVNGSFDPLVSLEMLFMNGTSIVTIPEGLLGPCRDTLKYIDFSQNDWSCDQFLAWFPDWINGLYEERRNTGTVLKVAQWADATCDSPPKFKGTAIVRLTTEKILSETYDIAATLEPTIKRPILIPVLTPLDSMDNDVSQLLANPDPGTEESGVTSGVTKTTKVSKKTEMPA